MRIHKTHKRYISSVVAGLIVTAVTMTGFSYSDKTVTVMVDGAAHTVRTHLNSNEGIVRDAGVKLNPNDKVISSSSTVQNGTTLTVVRAIPVYVTVNGKTRAVFTTETTAQGVANELGFKAPNYVVVGDENGSVLSGTRITIAQVTSRSLSTVDQEVAVEVVRQKDDTMAKGEEEVVQVGQPGLERVQRETLYSNGTVIKTNDVSKVTQRAMVPTIIKEGTREVTTSRNVAGRASRAIVMEASAYLAGDGDGITATGLPAVRGIAAVDPDVIPLGTRLFIPGYGEAIAADTGGAIVGNKIDLVMDSYGEAMDFGRQDVTVYVLD